ncbi:ATP-binding protein [Anseongella ginsenosidimutans]|nr:ATP-binding protein [Anseongella ginsenosidimutans]
MNTAIYEQSGHGAIISNEANLRRIFTPRNKLIAGFCGDIGMIEKYGSGIRRVFSHFKTAGLPPPEFRNILEGFQITIFDGKKSGRVAGSNERQPIKKGIIECTN